MCDWWKDFATRSLTESIHRTGFAIVPKVVSPGAVDEILGAMDRIGSDERVRQRNGGIYAMRNLLEIVPEARMILRAPTIRAVLAAIVGESTRLVRALLFDKTPQANWKVGWHQDLSIAVARQVDAPGYGPWSVKAGVPHVQPPVDVLENMLTVRVHLDECGPENGPLNVIPGSHALGILTPEKIEECRARQRSVCCTAARGAALFMRPLLLHSSSSAAQPSHRRVLHLEFASGLLPGGAEWYHSERVFG